MALLLCGGRWLNAGTTPEGFFDEVLTLGNYTGPGCDPGPTEGLFDYLCDGVTNESNIVPEEGLEIFPPVTDAGDCTGAGTPAVRPLHANAHLGGGGGPVIEKLLATGDLVDLDVFYAASDNVMAYSWVYINNLTGKPKNYTMAAASDDAIVVSVNGQLAYLGVGGLFCRGFGAAGEIQERFPITLNAGGNLIQIKMWDGCCGWGFRVRLEDFATCKPVISGEGEIEVGTDPIAVSEPPAKRTIVTSGSTQADISLAVKNAGGNYTLEETFDAGWAVSNVVPVAGSTVAAGSVKWTGVTAANVSYRLSRATDFTTAQGVVSGKITLTGSSTVAVTGDSQISGGIPPYVPAVLLTPAFQIAGDLNGCTVSPTEIDGAWITDGGSLTDANIVPSEGLEFQVAFGGASQSDTMSAIGATVESNYWVSPGDALGQSRLVKVEGAAGFFDWQRLDVYEVDVNDAMNVAYFYAINTGATAKKVNIGFGSDDSGGVRVNGRPALTTAACRGNPGFADKFQATLDPGKNLIACYTFENGGGFNMAIRFEDENFQGLSIKTTLDPAGYNPAAHPDPGPAGLYFVPEALVTPAFDISGKNGCTVTADDINGNWISDTSTTDANIIPSEGLEIVPEFLGDAPLTASMSAALSPAAQTKFWSVPGDPTSPGLLARVGSGGGRFDWQGATAYDADVDVAMNVAYFYVINPDPTPKCYFLGFGSDDAGGVRVNGRQALTTPACRANNVFGDKFAAQFDPGKNLVACYVFENGGGFDLTIRIEDETGRPVAMPRNQLTLDPTGYNPAAHPEPTLGCKVGGGDIGAYSPLGFITKFFVPKQPFLTLANTDGSLNTGMVPEDFISIDGFPADTTNVAEGARAQPGSTGVLTTEIIGNSSCGFTPLVLFDGVNGKGATAGDPGLFNGETFYGSTDTYTSSLFFFLRNKTGADHTVYIGYSSDDGASLFVNLELVGEALAPRGVSAANTVASGPFEAVLVPGLNIVQLSYNEGGGGSGARVGVWENCRQTELLDPTKVEVVAPDPPAVGVNRSLAQLDCTGKSKVTLTVDLQNLAGASLSLSETVPDGVTGSNPSKGSFDGAGKTLTFNGNVLDNEVITYNVSGASPANSYCFGTANGHPISGQSTFRAGTDFCGDISNGIYVDCGGGGFTDPLGHIWSPDTLANPSQYLTSPNANTAIFGIFTSVNVTFDSFVADREYPKQIFPSERWNDGPIEYTFTNLPNGCYEVVSLFMEGCCSTGCDSTLEDPALSGGTCRVFDVLVNGQIPTNDLSPAIGGADGDNYSQWIAAGNQDRVATHLVTRVNVTDGTIIVQVNDLGAGAPPENASIKGIVITPTTDCGGGQPLFHRGDADNNGSLQLTDAVRILNVLFLGVGVITCKDSADADDNGSVQLTDAVRILNVLFLGVGSIPNPGPPPAACGPDTTPDSAGDLGCDSYTHC